MKTVIIYASKHGCTEMSAEKVKDLLDGDVEVVPVKMARKHDLNSFDRIIIGGSIHAGMLQGAIKKFCQSNLKRLLTKKVGLFLCCMEEGDKAWEQFNNGYPEKLRNHATAKGLFGGAFNFERMNAIEKAIIKKISGTDKSISKVSDDAIKTFVKEME